MDTSVDEIHRAEEEDPLQQGTGPGETSMTRYDYLFKLLLVGNTEVGKTALLRRFVQGDFDSEYLPTVAIDFKMKIVNVRGKDIKLQIWDASGLDRFAELRTNFYLGASGVIFAFDVNDRSSFESINNKWVGEVLRKTEGNDLVKCLVACKCDDADAASISNEEAQNCAIIHGARFCSTSARQDFGVDGVFKGLASAILAKEQENWDPGEFRRAVSTSGVNRASVILRHLGKKSSPRRAAQSLRKSFRFRRQNGTGQISETPQSTRPGEPENEAFVSSLSCFKFKFPSCIKAS